MTSTAISVRAFTIASVVCVAGFTQACSSSPQAMSDYQRQQIQLQQQLANEAANRAAVENAAILNSATQIFGQAPDYSGSTGQARCVTGLDGLGRLVTECEQQ